MKHTAYIGFLSMNDFFKTLIGYKSTKLNCIMACLCGLTGFITKYVYDSSQAVYFMLFLLAVDAGTGILRSIKGKTFSSSRLPRCIVITIVYCLMLSISWNASRFSPVLEFLPGLVYGGLISTLIVSVFENLYLLGLLPKSLFDSVIDKIKNKKQD